LLRPCPRPQLSTRSSKSADSGPKTNTGIQAIRAGHKFTIAGDYTFEYGTAEYFTFNTGTAQPTTDFVPISA
jgi:hypothetical protein